MYIDSTDPMAAMLAAYHADKAAASAPATTAPVEVATPAPKAVPSTTYEACEKYGATPYRCGCPDRAKRDGSYVGLDGRKACKHMVFHQKYYTDIAI